MQAAVAKAAVLKIKIGFNKGREGFGHDRQRRKPAANRRDADARPHCHPNQTKVPHSHADARPIMNTKPPET